MRTRTIKLSPAGSAGAATASAQVGIPTTTLRAVRVATAGQSSGTTDVTLTSLGQTVATLANLGNGEAVAYPRALASAAEDGADLDTAGDEARVAPIVHNMLTVAVANGDARTDGVIVTIFIEDGD